jgi:hypothetical protein
MTIKDKRGDWIDDPNQSNPLFLVEGCSSSLCFFVSLSVYTIKLSFDLLNPNQTHSNHPTYLDDIQPSLLGGYQQFR